jgi:hypothetical protein
LGIIEANRKAPAADRHQVLGVAAFPDGSAKVNRRPPGYSCISNLGSTSGVFPVAADPAVAVGLRYRGTFILHAKGAKLPTDLLGMTAVRYPEALTAADMRAVNQKVRKAIEDEGRLTRLEGDWWQHSLTLHSEREPPAISLLRISRDRDGGLDVAGRGWQEDGTLSSRY